MNLNKFHQLNPAINQPCEPSQKLRVPLQVRRNKNEHK